MLDPAAEALLMAPLRTVADVAADPGVQRITQAIQQRCGAGVSAWLVGGAVRDLLVGVEPREYDIAIAGDAIGVARQLVDGGGSLLATHDAFGTADIMLSDGHEHGIRMDLAVLRREEYPTPGALPLVSPVEDIGVDVVRRDVTINALAWQISPQVGEHIIDGVGGLSDLGSRTIRVLHDRSFLDDPTRLFRCARYAARFGEVEAHTVDLAREAVRRGALATISPARIGHELDLVMAEQRGASVAAALQHLDAWGVVQVVIPDGMQLPVSVPGREGAGDIPHLNMEAADALRRARWASLCAGVDRASVKSWLTGLGMHAGDVRMIVALSAAQHQLAERVPVHDLLAADRDIIAAIDSSWGDHVAGGWIDLWDQAHSFITGRDLHELGMVDGPHMGVVLARVRARIYDGSITTRGEALDAARSMMQQQAEGT